MGEEFKHLGLFWVYLDMGYSLFLLLRYGVCGGKLIGIRDIKNFFDAHCLFDGVWRRQAFSMRIKSMVNSAPELNVSSDTDFRLK